MTPTIRSRETVSCVRLSTCHPVDVAGIRAQEALASNVLRVSAVPTADIVARPPTSAMEGLAVNLTMAHASFPPIYAELQLMERCVRMESVARLQEHVVPRAPIATRIMGVRAVTELAPPQLVSVVV